MQTNTAARRSIDLTGKTITTYIVYQSASILRELSANDVLEIITDDFAPIEPDIRAWCRMSGNDVVRVEREADRLHVYVRKAPPTQPSRKLAMVLSNPGLEELLSPLGFALAGVLSGVDVHLYFQGPAVKVLTSNFREHLSGMSRPFSGFARHGLADAGHLPPHEKLQQLYELGAHFYLCGGSMGHFGVTEEDVAFDDVKIVEYFSFLEVMSQSNIHVVLL